MEERLQKIIARSGIASRRKVEEMILAGLVSVNGRTVTEPGTKADPERDRIRVGERLVRPPGRRAYILLHKPAGCVSTLSDPEGRPTVASWLRKGGLKDRVYPVGRLDYHATGLLLMTNDGDLANFLMSAATGMPRTYRVKLDAAPEPAELKKLESGIALDGRKTAPAKIRPMGSWSRREKPWYEMTLIEGRYHQVRRMFERIGTPVVKLKRVRMAFLTIEGLAPGEWRHLSPTEVQRLKNWRAGRQVVTPASPICGVRWTPSESRGRTGRR